MAAESVHHRVGTSTSAKDVVHLAEFVRNIAALHGEELALLAHERHRPREQPRQWSHGTGRDDVEGRAPMQPIGPPTDHLDVLETEGGNDFRQEGGPPQKRLNQRD